MSPKVRLQHPQPLPIPSLQFKAFKSNEFLKKSQLNHSTFFIPRINFKVNKDTLTPTVLVKHLFFFFESYHELKQSN